jgi:hypothetical protein
MSFIVLIGLCFAVILLIGVVAFSVLADYWLLRRRANSASLEEQKEIWKRS